MIFGNASQLAIEAKIIGAEGKWIFGHLRFWVAGNALGDFEDTSDLAGSARWGRRFLSASPRRTRPDLDEQDVDHVYWILFARFFKTGGSALDELFERAPYILDDVGESSLRDRVSVLAVRRSDGRDRIIVHDHRVPGKSWEEILPVGMCDEVVASYCSWVETQLISS